MKPKYYLFDFDGVLVDSMETWVGVHAQTLLDAEIPVPEGFAQTITPLGNYHGAKYTLSLGVDIPLDQYLEVISQKLFHAYTTHIRLKPNVKTALHQLKQAGISINVLTASPHLYVDPCLKRHGIFELFDHVWTIEDFDLTKAQPEIYRQAAARLHTDIFCCTMLDDNFTVIETASKTGMQTIAVYDSTSKNKENALRNIAGQYIYDFKELLIPPTPPSTI